MPSIGGSATATVRLPFLPAPTAGALNGVLHKAATLLQRYMSLAGGYTGHLGDYSTGAAQAINALCRWRQ